MPEDAWIWSLGEYRRFLTHPSEGVRAWALRRVSLFAPNEFSKEAVRLLLDPKEEVRDSALSLLERTRPGEAAEALLHFARQRKLPVQARLRALRALPAEAIQEAAGLRDELLREAPEAASLEAAKDSLGLERASVALEDPGALEALLLSGALEEREALANALRRHPEALKQLANEHLLREGCTEILLEALRAQPYQWASRLLIDKLPALVTREVLSLWDSFAELSDPAMLDPLISEWRPEEPHLASVICEIAEVAGKSKDISAQIRQEAKEPRQRQKALGGSMLGEMDADAPLTLQLRCNRCERSYQYKVEGALLHPDPKRCQQEGWDGIFLRRVIVCKGCGAEDNYTISQRAAMYLMIQAARNNPRVKVSVPALSDGTRLRRASDGIEISRERLRKNPKSPELWRKLGDALQNADKKKEAEEAYREALGRDPEELESLLRLAELYWDKPEGFGFLSRAFTMLPLRKTKRELRLEAAVQLTDKLREYTTATKAPLTLQALWEEGKGKKEPPVRISAATLQRLDDWQWEALPRFLVEARLHLLKLGEGSNPEHPSRLEEVLSQGRSAPPRQEEATREPISPPARWSPAPGEKLPGPTDPCPCGSGKRYKKCCMRR